MRILSALFSSVLAASPLAAQAQAPLDYPCRVHPAVAAPSQFPRVDPSTVIVGHPASPTWRVVHANDDHPAVVVKHDWATRAIDPNTFVVQPPAHARWLSPKPVEVAAAISPVEVPAN